MSSDMHYYALWFDTLACLGKVWKGVWRWYHEDMLECCTSLEEIKVHGLHMQQLSCIAKCNQLNSVLVFANENLSLDALR